MKFSLSEIARLLNAEQKGLRTGKIHSIIIDSRKAVSTPHTLFVAIRGERNDGHQFIASLIEKGVKYFLVQQLPEHADLDNHGYILVKNSLHALQQIASWARVQFKGDLLAITGSNGKTIVKEWISQALSGQLRLSRSPLSYNSQVGVPLSLLRITEDSRLAIVEAGISKPGEMEKLEKMIRPDIGIMTNIGQAHQENFSSLDEKIREKLLLFKDVSKLIYNSDYAGIHRVAKEILPPGSLVNWSRTANSHYTIESIKTDSGSIIRIRGKAQAEYKIPYSDAASVENSVHCIVFLTEYGIASAGIEKAMLSLQPVSMRMEMLKGLNNCILINDSYNSDPGSLSNALDFLMNQTGHSKRSLIISDILQSGLEKTELYKPLAETIKSRGVDRIIAIGNEISSCRSFFPSGTQFYDDTESFLSEITHFSFRNEVILLKGARVFEFERITSELQELTHRTVLEIDLSALLENYRYYRSLLQPGVKMMAMVKAFSYGSGGYEVASLLQYQNIEYLAVAYADEGVMLRKNGIETPVMVMNPEKTDFNQILRYNLEPEIYNFRILKAFDTYLLANGVEDYPVHLKLDTGMHRLGFGPEELKDAALYIRDSRVRLVSVFSHLAAADDPGQDLFTHKQIGTFRKMCALLETVLSYSFLRHILNTSGIERFPEAQFDMVRPGIGLYGVSASLSEGLKEVSTFKTRVSQIKELPEGESVGYNRKGITRRVSRIATIPVGYADGIPGTLGQGVGKFMINHHLAPIIGKVCMDMCMLDITEIKASEEDEVIIFGREHSVMNFASDANIIPYEALTGISSRVKRIYYQE